VRVVPPLAVLPTTSDKDAWSDDERAAVEAAGLVFTYSYGERAGERVLAPRAVVQQFLHLADRSGLDPLARQLYCIGRQGRNGIEWSIQTGIDGFRLVAERSKKYAGQEPARWLTKDGIWVTAFIKSLHGDNPLAAEVRVHRHDWSRDLPAVGVATWEEYAQFTSKGDLTSMWKSRGPGQLAKCAEALALRKAFPQDLSGLYTEEEAAAFVGQDAVEGEQVVPARARSRVNAAQGSQEASEVVEAVLTPETDSVASGADTGRDVADAVVFDKCERCGRVEAPPGMPLCESCEVELEAEAAALADEEAKS
jgi:phage recombination protein Bet